MEALMFMLTGTALMMWLSTDMTLSSHLSAVMTLFLFYSEAKFGNAYMAMDSLSLTMICLSLVVFTMVSTFSDTVKVSLFLLMTMELLIVVFFLSKSFLVFYTFFEMSLVPLLVLLVWEGKQPERLSASAYFVLFTIVPSVPLMILSLYMEKWNIPLWSGMSQTYVQSGVLADLIGKPMGMSSLAVSLTFIPFLIKAPIYAMHTWLPRAHVEASLVGSMILAGVMLKFGLYGILRMLTLFQVNYLKVLTDWVFGLSVLGMVVSGMIVMSSDDLKMSVAYSSICHMNACVASLMSMKEISVVGAVTSMVVHGLISPLLFVYATKIYEMTGSRSLLINKGVIASLSTAKLSSLVLWVMNFSVPPCVSFIGELLMVCAILSFTISSVLFVGSFLVIGGVFSVLIYTVVGHSAIMKPMKVNEQSVFFKFTWWVGVVMFALITQFAQFY